MSLPRYPKYKDSGVEWLGEVPEHWDARRIRLLFEIRKRIAGSEGYDVLSITQQGIKIKDIESNDGQLSMDYSKYQFVEVGDFAMNHMDLLTGYVDISNSVGVTSPDYRVFSLRNQKVCHDRYYLYIFQNAYKQKLFYAFGQGSSQLGRWRLPTEQFNDFVLPLPCIEEQKAIAAFLDRETAKIDALVEEQRRLIELLKEKRQAVISHAVTKGLNPHAKMKPSGIEWLGDVPEHWNIVPLRFLVQFISGGTPDKKDSSYWDGSIPWISSKDMKVAQIADAEDHISERAVIESGLKIIPAHHILMVVRGMILAHSLPIALTLGDVTINQDIKALKCASRLAPLFLQFVFEGVAAYIVANAGESAHGTKKLETEMLGKLPIPVPPVAEQDRIVAKLHRRLALLEDVSISAQETIDLLRERRAALISAAVTGKIDVRAQDARPAAVSKLYTVGFARQLLAAEILHVCHNHPTTGRVKLQKLIHLCEHHAEIDEIHANYLRKAAGPFDNRLMFGVAAGLSRQKWYSEVKDGNRTIYRPLEKAGGHKKYLVRWDNKLPSVHQVLELLGKAQTQQCEIVSTLYAAWNDLLIEGRQPTDAEIVREASDPIRWHENKAKIPAEKWPRALRWMRDNGLVPKGYGSHTKHDPTAKENA